MRIPRPVRWSLTLLTVNGRTMAVTLPVSADGRVRVSVGFLARLFGIPDGGAMRIGR